MISKIALAMCFLVFVATLCFGHTASKGVSTTTDLVVNSSAIYTNLLSSTFTLTNHNHQCSVIASAQAENPANSTVDNRYVFNISFGGVMYETSSRTIEFDDNVGVDDVGTIEVSTAYNFLDIEPGTYTVQWRARKETEGDLDMTVSDSSMTIICTKSKLQQ